MFNDPNCFVDKGVDCSKQDCVYIITCNSCQEQVGVNDNANSKLKATEPGDESRLNYVGMTGTSLHARAASHLKSIKTMNMNNALARHIQSCHGGAAQLFSMRLMSNHRTCMNRYKTEAVTIEKQMQGTSLNDKMEGGRGGVVRISARVDRM